MAKQTRSSESEGKRSKNKGRSGAESESRSEDSNAMSTMMENLPQESQEAIERILGEVRRYADTTKEYISENPREAAGLAVTAGFVTWALLGTKPGRIIFESASAYAVPQVSRWFFGNLSGITSRH